MSYYTYIINFDKTRLPPLLQQFHKRHIYTPSIPAPVFTDDPRFTGLSFPDSRIVSITTQHLDAMREFIENCPPENRDKTVCIICEDDILISKRFSSMIENVIQDFFTNDLDVLLLGYLLSWKLEGPNHHFPLLFFRQQQQQPQNQYHFYGFPEDIWGSQMYMVSYKHAVRLVETYTVLWASQYHDIPYSPDWILTKKGKRALLYPPLVIENGETPTDHVGQRDFHRACYNALYNEEEFGGA